MNIVVSMGAVLLLAAAVASADAPNTSEAVVRQQVQASDLLQLGKFSQAVSILKKAEAADGRNSSTLRMLASAYQLDAKPDLALSTYQTLLKLEPDSPQALYGIGLIHAKRHELEPAFAWFGKARDTHKIDMTALDAEKELDDLRKDPRYALLMPGSDAFKQPFVEDVKIIREWDGEAAQDQFGWIARSIGDVDGDGIADFVTSAPSKNINGDDAGRVYVYSSASGRLIWSVDGKPGDQLGSGLESAGDVNGDGVEDVIASAPGADKAYVYSGKDGHVLVTFSGEAKGDTFGNHVSSVGDIDHDGFADVIVGAPYNNAAGHHAGRAYVYSGKDGHLLCTMTGQHAEDEFGSAVSGFSDAKFSFVVAGAPGAGVHRTGRIYVYTDPCAKPKFTFDSDDTGKQLGYMFVSILGDVDGDGVPDIFASDWRNAAKGPATGRVYVYSGKTGKRIRAFTGETPGEGFGTTQSVAGDVDGDGVADLIVGSWQYGGAAVSGGRAYLYSGKSGRLLKTYTSKVPGETFGFDAVAIGDVDGDGTSDLLITSGWSAVHGNHSGRVFLISSGVNGKPGNVAAH